MELKKFYPNENLNQQRFLFNECFPESDNSLKTKDHYNWKFHSHPSKPNSYEYAGFINNDLVSYYAAIPFEYLIDGKIYTVGFVCDVMTARKARGKGVFTKTGSFATNDLKKNHISFTIGYPIRQEVMPGHLKIGWKKLFSLPIYFSPIASNSFLKKIKLSFLSLFVDIGLNFFHKSLNLFSKKKLNILKYDINQIDYIKDFDNFIEIYKTENKITLNKNIKFLKWRLGAPNTNYKIFVAYKNDILVGYSVITRTIKNGITCCAILDLCFLNKYSKFVPSMINSIKNYSKKNKLDSIIIMSTPHISKKYNFLKSGLFKTPFKFNLIIKNLSENTPIDILNNIKNWNLNWIDSDNL